MKKLLLISLLVVLPLSVLAEEKHSLRVEVTPFIGSIFKSDFSVADELDLTHDYRYLAGGRLAIFLSDSIGVEGYFGYSLSSVFVTDNEAETKEKVRYSTLIYGGDLVINLGNLDMIPFIAGGVARVSYRLPEEASSFPVSGDHYELNIGGGMKYFWFERLAFRGDFRWRFIFLGDEGMPTYTSYFELTGSVSFVLRK
jgi:hypothetical protein